MAGDITDSDSPSIRWDRDADGIVTLTFDDPGAPVNTMNAAWERSLAASVRRLEAERESVTGVILASAKQSFFAGGDLSMLSQGSLDHAAEHTAQVNAMKDLLRRLERLGRPVVAALNGTALGGGLEIALAAHHRVAADLPGSRFGFPEVTLGLLPGGGGITRTVRLLGLQRALVEVILSGKKFSPADALEIGLVDEIVGSAADLVGAAKAWISGHPGAAQPWDQPGFKIPGGSPTSPALASQLPAFPATLRKQLKGAPYPAPRAALAAAVEGALVDFDTAAAIETRYLVGLITGQVAKNMIKALFFDLQHINSGGSRPAGHPQFQARKVGILGAGMMGAAIAYVCAQSGIDVVLKDVDEAAARRGLGYAEKLEAKRVAAGKSTAEKSSRVLGRIHPAGEAADLAGVDLVIEAVFESVEVKAQVFREIESIVEPDAVLGSNTSTLPISLLARAVGRPADFIGIHFFSPVDKMPLVEIVRGRQTSDAVLAKAFDFVQQIRKTPIVVNDSRGFFTSRVIGTFINEAVAAVGEGVEPATIEQAALQAGYPAGALQLLDELTITLPRKIREEARRAVEAAGGTWVAHPSEAVVDRMIDEFGRRGRSTGAGFYDYDEDGRRSGLWSGLREAWSSGTAAVPFVDLQERMLFAEAVETVRCVDDGVLTSVPDANIGSIYGIGFPSWTGGVLQYINQYPGGPTGFVARARELADKYGAQFVPPESLVELAAAGGSYR